MFSQRKVIILSFLSLLYIGNLHPAFSQKKCGTVEYNIIQKKGQINSESDDIFENWINNKRATRANQSLASKSASPEVYKIPVVVHVIHNGEPLNTDGNISDEQILAQIDTLNKDFRRLNADRVNTPNEFEPVAADVGIEFILAKRDPEGLPTTGIIRKQGTRSVYSMSNDVELKSQSYWPAEEYLNLWITDLNSGFLGYARFPTSNLEGLDQEQSISRLTDGVVLDWKFTGTNFNTGAFASLGRTATHEIGHFLGLRHIWGDGGCSVDDFCTDTPQQGSSTNGCPSEGSQVSCNSENMFQNYMDFSDDLCMNLFTICQSERMRIIIENSPRRKDLLTSKGANDPIFVANDLGIREILAPLNGNCNSAITPQVEVKNYGSNDISSFEIDLYIDNNLIESVSKSVSLSYLSTNLVSFLPISNTSGTSSILRFQITNTNLTNDGNNENDNKSIEVNFPIEVAIPYTEDFENGATDWSIKNSTNDNSASSFSNAPNIDLNNTGFQFNYFESVNTKFGQLDWLMSPVFDFSALPSVDLNFKYSYSAISGNITDVLSVAISTDCGITFREEDYIFQKFSPDLRTTANSTNSFVPLGPSDWEEVVINLTDFVGHSDVIIAFIGHNGGGNNIYIDDVQLTSDNVLAYNLGVVDVSSMPLSTCLNDIFPTVDIKNFGFETISSFDLTYNLNGLSQTNNTNSISLLPGKTHSVFIPINDITIGEHQIQFEVSNPNGNMDEQSSNNALIRNFDITDDIDVIPIREDFEEDTEVIKWNLIRANDAQNFSLASTSGNGFDNKSLLVNGYSLNEIGAENWLISPTLDFTPTDSASITFKVSYANIIGRNDQLEVKVSTNCGQSYNHTIYNKKGASLAVKETIDEWFPESSDDWITEFLDLTEFTVWSSIKIAFVLTTQNGNNLFLDDIEIYNQGSPTISNFDKNQITIFPNPASTSFNAKFNLENKDNLTITLTNMAGDIVFRENIMNMLNQEFSINTQNLLNGIYVLHAVGTNTNISKRVLIVN